MTTCSITAESRETIELPRTRLAATNKEVAAALWSEGVLDRLSIEPSEVVEGDSYMINNRMLLILIEHSEYIVEAHLAQPKEHWKDIHRDIEQALNFIQLLGYNEVYTNVREPLKTTLNLLKKHNFKQIDHENGEVILKWESKQHY